VQAYYQQFCQCFDALYGHISLAQKIGLTLRNSAYRTAPISSPAQTPAQRNNSTPQYGVSCVDASPATSDAGVCLSKYTPDRSPVELSITVTLFNKPTPSTSPVPYSAVSSINSHTGDDYPLTVTNSLAEPDTNEINSVVLFSLADSNSVLTKEATATLSNVLVRRDYALWFLYPQDLVLIETLAIYDDIIQTDATQTIGYVL
jgi:hypothetical protein